MNDVIPAGANGVDLLASAQRALEAVKTVKDAKNVRDRAEAIRQYLRQQRYCFELQQDAAEIKVWAERKIGELLGPAGTPGKHAPPHNGEDEPRSQLKSRWRAQALVPAKVYREHIAECRKEGQEITSAALFRIGNRLARQERQRRANLADDDGGDEAATSPSVTIPASWSSRNYHTLRAQALARPAFADRQEDVRQLEADVRRLEADVRRLEAKAERLRKKASRTATRAREAEQALHDSVREVIRAEHGPIVRGGEYDCPVRDQKALKEYLAIEVEDERREWLLRRYGLCLHCGTRLGPADAVPDEPGSRYVHCRWCRECRGETHCDDCGAPLQEGEEVWCRQCNPPAEPLSEEERERLIREFVRKYGPFSDLNLGPEPGDGAGAKKSRRRAARGK
jgi:hypothetical protein